MKIGGYRLDLYCDNHQEDLRAHPYGSMPLQYVGESRRECIAKAKSDGWTLSDKQDLCPVCSKQNPNFFKGATP